MPTPPDRIIEDAIVALAAPPSFGEVGVALAARPSGLWLTDDGCRSWHKLPAAQAVMGNAMPTTVCVAGRAGGELLLFAGVKGAVLKSHDGGETWQASGLGAPPPVPTTLLALSPLAHNPVMLVGTLEDGVFRSEDGGETWKPWNFGLVDWHVLALAAAPNNPAVVACGTETMVFVSRTGGRSWQTTAFPSDAAPVVSVAFGGTDSVLYAGTEGGGLLRSTDRGHSWQPLAVGVGGEALDAIVTSADGRVVVLRGGGLVASRDHGTTWYTPVHHHADADATALFLVDGPTPGNTLLVGNRYGRVDSVKWEDGLR